MRRIIERVVTVVTTTTWKISWEADSSQTEAPISNDLSSLNSLSETLYDTQISSDEIETKEVQPPEREEQSTDQNVEEPLNESYPYPTKIERKSKP
jgi:hypothetical protein